MLAHKRLFPKGWMRPGIVDRACCEPNGAGVVVPDAPWNRGRDFRLLSVSKDSAPSCFHSASTGAGNANAAPEGGA